MSRLRINLTGQKFGRLKVLQYVGRNKCGDSRWLCVCDCGRQTTVNNGDLKTGNTKSCGCLRIKHGHSKSGKVSQIYIAWQHMLDRCTNPDCQYYSSYGGRNISVCKRWSIFENFLVDMGEPPTESHSIDRIDNNGDYCPKNCRWATKRQQQGNMRSNHMITFNNKTQCLAAWSRKTSINQKTLWHRLVTLGWSIQKSLTTPTRRRVKA